MKGSDAGTEGPDTRVSCTFPIKLQTADHRILGRDPLDETLFRVRANGTQEIIQGARVGRVRDDSRFVGAPGNPLAGILGQLVKRETRPVREEFPLFLEVGVQIGRRSLLQEANGHRSQVMSPS